MEAVSRVLLAIVAARSRRARFAYGVWDSHGHFELGQLLENRTGSVAVKSSCWSWSVFEPQFAESVCRRRVADAFFQERAFTVDRVGLCDYCSM